MPNILIVDDHPSTRDGLVTRIGLEPDLKVCGQAADVDEALQLIRTLQPHIAIIDVSLKTGNGIELIKLVKAEELNTRMLVWSMYDESLYAERALRAGAMGYINKENVTGVIIDAIRRVLVGEIFVSPELAARMLHRVVRGTEAIGQSPVDALSDRELETFECIGRGMKTVDIADKMGLSPKTIETYRARIKEKLDLEDMASLTREAVQWTIENG